MADREETVTIRVRADVAADAGPGEGFIRAGGTAEDMRAAETVVYPVPPTSPARLRAKLFLLGEAARELADARTAWADAVDLLHRVTSDRELKSRTEAMDVCLRHARFDLNEARKVPA